MIMGTSPKTIERVGMEALAAIVSERLHFQPGHEIKADTFVAIRSSESQQQEENEGGGWLPIQVKVASTRTPVWARKMRHILNTEKTALHGCVLLGFSLRPADKCFLLLVHKLRCYEGFDVDAPGCNFARPQIAAAIIDIMEGGSATLLQNPSRSLVHSQETLIEHDARRDFKKVLRGSRLRYDPPGGEYGPVDGFLRAENTEAADGVEARIQEKVCQWRWDRGQTLCLRAKICRHVL